MTHVPIRREYDSIILVSIDREKNENEFNFLRTILPTQHLQKKIYRGRERFGLLKKIESNLKQYFIENFSSISLKQLIEMNFELKREYLESSSAWGKFWDYLLCLMLRYRSENERAVRIDSLDMIMQKLYLLYNFIDRLCLVLKFDCYLGGDISIESNCNHIVVKTKFGNTGIINCIQSYENRYYRWFLEQPCIGIKTTDSHIHVPNGCQRLMNGWINEIRFLHSRKNGRTYLLSFYIGNFDVEKVSFVDLLSQVLSKYLSKGSSMVENYLGTSRIEFQMILFAFFCYLSDRLDSSRGENGCITIKKSDFVEDIASYCEKYTQVSDISDLFDRNTLHIENGSTIPTEEILRSLYYGLGFPRKEILEKAREGHLKKKSVFSPSRGEENEKTDIENDELTEIPLKKIDFDWHKLIENLLTRDYFVLSYKHNKRFEDITKEKNYIVVELPDDQLVIPFVSKRWLRKDLCWFLEFFVQELERGGLIGQVKGRLYERIIESALREYDNEMVFYPIAENKVDLVFGSPPFLFAIECKYRHPSEKIRTGEKIRSRWREIREWIKQSTDWADYVAGMFPEIIPIEFRKDFNFVVPVVLTFHPEFLMSLRDEYTLSKECPRVCTLGEFLEFIDKIDLIELMGKPYIIRIGNGNSSSK